MRTAVLAGLMVVAGWAGAQPAKVETRAATVAEARAFAAFYQSQHGDGAPPSLTVQRAPGGKQWQLSASTDAAPVRAVLPLCRLQRTSFAYTAGQWQALAPAQTYVWIHHTPQCGVPPAQLVQLRAPLAEMEILRLIQQQAELLQRSRLLMAGNTSCAATRARSFRLAALDRAKDGMPQLIYRSDIDSTATITIRQTGSEFSAWNVLCGP